MDAIRELGPLTYAFLFLLAFAETILILTPFLPGPSLLFAAGAIAARPGAPLDVVILFFLFVAGGVLGDAVNFALGRAFGLRIAAHLRGKSATPHEGLAQAKEFFEKHSGKTIVMARLVPGLRTLTPIVAGGSLIRFRRFAAFNLAGGFLAVAVFLFAGYFFGSTPLVRNHFALVIVGIAVISVLPAAIEWMRFRRERQPPK